MANTANLNLPLIDDNMVADVSRDLNALAEAVDAGVTAQAADYTTHTPYGGTTTGTANTYAISLPISSLVVGMAVSIKINIASTGSSTLNWDDKGAKALKKVDGTNITNLKANGIYTFRYDGTSFIVQGEGGEYGTAVAGEVLTGKTIGTGSGLVSGTMPNYSAYPENGGYITAKSVKGDGQGSLVFEPQTGYYEEGLNGGGYGALIAVDPEYVPSSFRADRNVYGVQGTIPVKAGVVPALGGGQWGDGGIAVYPPEGYYKGGSGDGELKLTSAQLRSFMLGLTESNIRNGISIGGVNGTLVEGKPYANGSTPGQGNSNFTISGLSFRPSIAWCRYITGSDNFTIGFSTSGMVNNSARYFDTTFAYTNATFTADGFTLSLVSTINSNTTITWYAYE